MADAGHRDEAAGGVSDRLHAGEREVGEFGAAEPGFLALHPDALRVELWSAAIGFVFWMGVATVGWLLSLLGGFPVFLLASAGWLTAALFFGFFSFYWPRVRHRHVSYRATPRGLEIRRGVLWRSHLFIARSRIQHTDVAQGPLQRRLDLARLIVHTAGTHNASTSLSGIHRDEARRIRELLTGDEGADPDDDGV